MTFKYDRSKTADPLKSVVVPQMADNPTLSRHRKRSRGRGIAPPLSFLFFFRPRPGKQAFKYDTPSQSHLRSWETPLTLQFIFIVLFAFVKQHFAPVFSVMVHMLFCGLQNAFPCYITKHNMFCFFVACLFLFCFLPPLVNFIKILLT